MLKVAVTGGAGSGKSIVCAEFKKLGAHVINLDMISREVVRPYTDCWQQIVDYFGKEILEPDDSINRRKLREIILIDPGARKDLEKLTHPEILHNMKKQMKVLEKTSPGGRLVTEVPLLFECGLKDFFDVVILVTATPSQQIHRLMKRDNVSAKSVKALLDIQLSTKEKRKYADFIIENSGTKENLSKIVLEIYEKLSKGLDRERVMI
ncbi:MAG: dephospho-CoA kinase [Pseudomonadota bacterium]